MNTRAGALSVLIKVTEHGAYLSDTLQTYSKELDKTAGNGEKETLARDKAFIARLCTGTVKRLVEMDARINLYAKTKVKKMHPIVRGILRMSVYQLYYMDAVPASAAVNEAVRLAKKNGQVKAAGFINGILRSMEREEKAWPFAKGVPADAAGMSTYFSMPEWLTEMFIDRFGTGEAGRILAEYLSAAPTAIRVNTSRITPEELKDRFSEKGVKVAVAAGNPEAFLLETAGAVERLPGFSEGWFFIQDLSSMEVVRQAGIKPGDRVVDVCAAPGGKALHAADAGGEVIARDVSEAKVARINENITRAGFDKIRAEVWDARTPDPSMKQKADIVIADLPCSGLGVLKRKPEIKYRLRPEDVTGLAALQRQILNVVCDYVKPGGRMVFSTCTLTAEENDGNTEKFLEDHPDFFLLSKRTILPDAVHDGFYIAVMERGETE